MAEKHMISPDDLEKAVYFMSEKYPGLEGKTKESEFQIFLDGEMIGRGPLQPHLFSESFPYNNPSMRNRGFRGNLSREGVRAYFETYMAARSYALGVTPPSTLLEDKHEADDWKATLQLLDYRNVL